MNTDLNSEIAFRDLVTFLIEDSDERAWVMKFINDVKKGHPGFLLIFAGRGNNGKTTLIKRMQKEVFPLIIEHNVIQEPHLLAPEYLIHFINPIILETNVGDFSYFCASRTGSCRVINFTKCINLKMKMTPVNLIEKALPDENFAESLMKKTINAVKEKIVKNCVARANGGFGFALIDVEFGDDKQCSTILKEIGKEFEHLRFSAAGNKLKCVW